MDKKLKLREVREDLEELIAKDRRSSIDAIQEAFRENRWAHQEYVQGINHALEIISKSYGLEYKPIKSEIKSTDID